MIASIFKAIFEFIWSKIFNRTRNVDKKAHNVNKKEQSVTEKEVEQGIKSDIEAKEQELEHTKSKKEWIDIMRKRQSE